VGGIVVSYPPGGAGGGAPTSSQYLTLANDGTLTAERVMTPGNGLSGTDAGANSTYTLAAKTYTLDQQVATGTLTGNSADQTIFTTTIPAAALTTGSIVRVSTWIEKLSGAASCTFKLFFGGTSTTINASAANRKLYTGAYITVTGASAETMIMGPAVTDAGAWVTSTTTAPAEAVSGSIVVKVTGNVANTDTFRGVAWIVEIIGH
jgi:hypothetical protein